MPYGRLHAAAPDRIARSSVGVPLDDETRAFMEARFRRDLRFVRIHTGAGAAAGARVLGARAFTIGHDIFFDAGEFAPGTATGMRLLAHELTHALQQRQRRHERRGPLAVGAAGDALEEQAELVADQVIRGARRSAITADRSRAVRRAVRVVPGSVRINIFERPQVHKPLIPDPGDPLFNHKPDARLCAFTCTDISAGGEVALTGDAEDIAGCTLGFIQVQWIETNWVYYRGHTNSDGSLLLQRGRPPARPQQACRDSAPHPAFGQIFFNPADNGTPTATTPQPVKVAAGFDDRVRDAARLLERNSKTGKVNFLREAQLEFHFCTILSLRNGGGEFRHLASFYWNAHWQARFEPTDFSTPIGKPWTIALVQGGNSANVSGIIHGPPSDARFTHIITAQNAGNCRDVAEKALTSVEESLLDGGPNPTFNPRTKRESGVWSNFDVRH